jgi:acetoin utilization protein AcuC
MKPVALYVGDELGKYGFPNGHPFGPDRQAAFLKEAVKRGLDQQAVHGEPRAATDAEIERFHEPALVSKVEDLSERGAGLIDYGDTPAYPGVYEATATVVGSALDGLARVMAGDVRRTFQPIGGLHHARRGTAAGFCVFNDCGVVIDTLRAQYGIRRVAYIDIDVHHGDGVFYPFESDPDVIFADIHEDGRFLYPGTGAAEETGKGAAKGTKLNLPLMPAAGDREFREAWEQIEEHLRHWKPEFILFQCGADSVAGDPLAHLQYTPEAHTYAAKRLCVLANELAQGRLMGFGGGGYNRTNLALAWCGVLEEFLRAD